MSVLWKPKKHASGAISTYDRSDWTFYSQTKVNSKTSKVIASRCLGIKKSLNSQGSVNQKENSSKSSA